ncbi:MAG: hypothetical protein EP301_07105 [Gammaproteobacteria bacterium]|nr:MAG: hypothetical protein EP301_07105 [Gammaproteobacteria bacterium]
MSPEEILSRPGRVLKREQRERYFERGCAVFPALVDVDWLQRLNSVTDAFVEASREVTPGSARRFDLEPARWARFDPGPCLMPPDWSRQGRYKSIFADQQKEG